VSSAEEGSSYFNFCFVTRETNKRLCESNDDLRAALEVSLFVAVGNELFLVISK
jgi:hypothetical protein